MNRFFSAVALAGFACGLAGLLLDMLPGASPGFSLPQIALIFSGAVMGCGALVLRREAARRRLFGALRQHWLRALFISAVTLIALEIGLAIAGLPTYFPTIVPEQESAYLPTKICDRGGCHLIVDNLGGLCQSGYAEGRLCVVNRQGFHDTQEFVAEARGEDTLRILALGDSFTFGMSAEPGHSFIEVMESGLGESATVWNSGLPRNGTRESLATFEALAPVMQPHVTLLGMFVNDFGDNTKPFQGLALETGADGKPLYRWKNRWGSMILIDEAAYLHYRDLTTDPPASEMERLFGTTRLGSLALRMADVIHRSAFDLEEAKLDVTRQYLRQLRDAAAAHKSDFLVLMIQMPLYPQVQKYYDEALGMLQALEIPYIDSREMLHFHADYAPPPDIHWSATGHGKIGALLAQCLREYQRDKNWHACPDVASP